MGPCAAVGYCGGTAHLSLLSGERLEPHSQRRDHLPHHSHRRHPQGLHRISHPEPVHQSRTLPGRYLYHRRRPQPPGDLASGAGGPLVLWCGGAARLECRELSAPAAAGGHSGTTGRQSVSERGSPLPLCAGVGSPSDLPSLLSGPGHHGARGGPRAGSHPAQRSLVETPGLCAAERVLVQPSAVAGLSAAVPGY